MAGSALNKPVESRSVGRSLRSSKGVLARSLALAGWLVFTIQAWIYANQQDSILDEGAYLLKGLLFVNGTYQPFQDFGPWTNHMPLAFIIPGYVQALFGPGLWAGRAFAILLGALFLVGTWLVVRRMTGEGWAAAVVWALALNPGLIKMYSVASSQSLVACFLVGVLFFSLGECRQTWQLLAGAALAGLLLLTRINMSPVVFLLLGYIFWAHGRRAGLLSAASALVVIGVGHAAFWPDILKMWYPWLPDFLQPLIAAWGPPPSIPSWQPVVSLENRAISFFNGLGVHFLATLGFGAAWLLGWRRFSDAGRRWSKEIIFLSALYVALFLAHALVSLGRNYCVFCFPVYLSFFQILGLIVLARYLSRPAQRADRFQRAGLLLGTPLVLAGIGYGSFSKTGPALLAVPLPRMRELEFQPGTVELWGLLANKFGFSYEFLLRAVPAVASLLAGGLLILAAFAVQRVLRRGQFSDPPGLANLFLVVLVLAGMALSPSILLGGGYQTYDCRQGRAIENYERAGAYLAGLIPPGSSVYWQGSLSAVPLLYLDAPRLYPPQINLAYSFRLSDNDRELEAFGLWNEPLGRRWLLESDFALVAERFYGGWVEELLAGSGRFEELPASAPLSSCDPGSYIRVFRRSEAR
jgi:hypothetical protein